MDTVRTWMSAPPVVAADTMPLPEARKLLAERGIRRLPVTNPRGELIGIVTEGDINRISDSADGDLAEYNLYYRVRDLPLREFMRRPVVSVNPDTPLREAAHLMLTWRIHGLPVIDQGRVVGVLTVSDLLRRMLTDEADACTHPTRERHIHNDQSPDRPAR
jgi:CBS domain-containing protein